MRRLLCLVTFCLLVSASSAEAFKRWPQPLDPTNYLLNTVTDPCGIPDIAGCATTNPYRIEIADHAVGNIFVLTHEKGHLAGWQYIDAIERCYFNLLIKAACSDEWAFGVAGPGEFFADVWANCRLNTVVKPTVATPVRRRYMTSYGIFLTGAKLREACTKLAVWDDDLA